MKRRESDSFLMLFLKLRGGINVYYTRVRDKFCSKERELV